MVRLLAVCVSLLSQGFPAGEVTLHYWRYDSVLLKCCRQSRNLKLSPSSGKTEKKFPNLKYVLSPKTCSFDDILPKTTSVDPRSWFNGSFYQQSYFGNLLFQNSHPSGSFQCIPATDNPQIFFMAPILHHSRSYLDTVTVLRITYSSFFYKKSFAFPILPCHHGLILAKMWQYVTHGSLPPDAFQPQLLWLWQTACHFIFWGWSDDRFVSFS